MDCNPPPQQIEPIKLNRHEKLNEVTMFKIKGLDTLIKKTKQLSSFTQEIDGELANVSFDPHDPISIEAAIHKAHDAIESKAQGYEKNAWIGALVEELKENAREQILNRAATARMENNNE